MSASNALDTSKKSQTTQNIGASEGSIVTTGGSSPALAAGSTMLTLEGVRDITIGDPTLTRSLVDLVGKQASSSTASLDQSLASMATLQGSVVTGGQSDTNKLILYLGLAAAVLLGIFLLFRR